jgi:hypothetical protein
MSVSEAVIITPVPVPRFIPTIIETSTNPIYEAYGSIRDKANEFMRQVEDTKLFPKVEAVLGQELFPANSLPPVDIRRYNQMAVVLEPGVRNIAAALGAKGTPMEGVIREKVHKNIMPKASSLARSPLVGIIKDPQRVNSLGDIASITYCNNTAIDTMKGISHTLYGTLEEAMYAHSADGDRSGFLTLFQELAPNDPKAFDFLKREVIWKALILPSRFDLKIEEPLNPDIENMIRGYEKKFGTNLGQLTTADGIAMTKMLASGFNICSGVGAIALDQEGAFNDTDRTVYEIMDSPVYAQLNLLGGAICRVADDWGDMADDKRDGIFNLFNDENGKDVIEGFCRIAGIDIAQINQASPKTILDSFVGIFEEKAIDQLRRPDLPESERKLLIIFLKSAVITYVNMVGDQELDAKRAA